MAECTYTIWGAPGVERTLLGTPGHIYILTSIDGEFIREDSTMCGSEDEGLCAIRSDGEMVWYSNGDIVKTEYFDDYVNQQT